MSDDTPTASEQDVLIIGGGIAGLAAALRLRALNSSVRITIVDAAARLGGKITSEIVAGCVVDGGADVCIGDKLRATHLFAALNLADRVVPVNPSALPTYELRDGRLQRLSSSFNGELLTFRGGMQELVDAACEGLDHVTVATDADIASLCAADQTWQAESVGGASYVADAIILAIPASTAATLLSSIAPHQAADVGLLAYPPTTTVTMAWHATDVPRAFDGTGYLATDESARVTACTWTSSKNPSHAAAGIALVRGYVRGADGDAAALMLEESSSVLGIAALPLFTRVYEWPAGIPTYTPVHEANVRALADSLAATPGLYVAGSAFHGVGIPDCIASGELAADAVTAYLAGSHPDGVA